MRTSDNGLFFLARHEGIVPGPYLDSVGVWTYGIGHAETSGLDPNPRHMPRGMPSDLTAELHKVFETFKRSIRVYEAAVNAAVIVPMAPHEFDAAVSFHYNTGGINRSTWVKEWNAGRKESAGRKIMNWRRPPEIIERREAEQNLWINGDYGSGKAHVWHVSDAGRVRYSRPARSLSEVEFLRLMGSRSAPATQPITFSRPPAPQPVGGLIGLLLRLFGRKS